jgi:hypothetical protein
MKTLRELADEVGFPFDAVSAGTRDTFKCMGIAPDGNALGWYLSGNYHLETATVENKAKVWTLAPKKKVLKSFVYETYNGTFHICTKYQEDPETWCKGSDYKLIKILDSIEVDA